MIKRALLVFLIFSAVLAVIYRLEALEENVKSGFKEIIPVIVAIHFIFLSVGIMLVGFPLAFVVKKLYDRSVSRLPKKLLALSRKSRKSFPLIHRILDEIIWVITLPFIFGMCILFIMLPSIGIFIPFEYVFYSAPVAGVFYLTGITIDFWSKKTKIV
jgi:hypothetical protein